MVNGRYRKYACDVKVMRGADVNSGHHLVVRKIQEKFCKNAKLEKSYRKMYNINRLKDPRICRTFQPEVRNRFQQLSEISEDGDTVNEKWTHIKEMYNKTAEKILRRRK
jgi:hypothetical protein